MDKELGRLVKELDGSGDKKSRRSKEILEKLLERQEEVLNKLPRNAILYRDTGNWGQFYQCGFCTQLFVEGEYFDVYGGKPITEHCTSCGTSFLENGKINIIDVTQLLGLEYEWEDLYEYGPYEFHQDQVPLERYGLTF